MTTAGPSEIAVRFGYKVTLRFEPEEPEQVDAGEAPGAYSETGLGFGEDATVDDEQPVPEPYAQRGGKVKKP